MIIIIKIINIYLKNFKIFLWKKIWGYVLEKWGFSLLLKLCTRRKKFFCFFSQKSSFSTTLSLRNELLNSHERLFSTKIRRYQVLTFIRTTLWAFTLTLWCIPFCVRKFILKICARGFKWSVNENLQSENWQFRFWDGGSKYRILETNIVFPVNYSSPF